MAAVTAADPSARAGAEDPGIPIKLLTDEPMTLADWLNASLGWIASGNIDLATGKIEEVAAELMARDEMAASASRSPAAGGVARAKPLDWCEVTVDRGDGTREADGWEAATGFGTHYAISIYADHFDVAHDYETLAKHLLSVDAAKATAQADFERRVTLAAAPAVLAETAASEVSTHHDDATAKAIAAAERREEQREYYRPDASGYSRADEEWFFDMDGKP